MKERRKELKMKYYSIHKIFFTSIIALLSVINFYAQEKPEKLARQSNKFIAEAQHALADNDFASAEASYRKAIATDPSNIAAKYNMGNL
ncbi:MAG: hypothetical protein KJP01_02955, partial [Gramella sp.]|nr:hypothetical protein [Christiangramia sp.]